MPVIKQRPFPGSEADHDTLLRLGAALTTHIEAIPSEVLRKILVYQACMFDLDDTRSHVEIREDVENFIREHKAGSMEEETARYQRT